jgi:predicted pyridoxine 5'-phosphate oxidase superfamily flavin-nucleotide-binding protein
MGRTYAEIDDRIAEFILSQPVFFVASAPLSGDGLVNCSPKSNNGELIVLDPGRVAYLDRTGSGVETIAHLRENGRIVLMFCAFGQTPRIVRIHGRGSVVVKDEGAFAGLAARFETDQLEGARSVIVVGAERVSDSCGYGVPRMSFESHRPLMAEFAARKGDDGIRRYWAEHNVSSLDGLPGIDGASQPGVGREGAGMQGVGPA